MGAEEVRQQMGDVLPTFLPLLAEAVTGGSTEKHIAQLDDMMKKGQVYTAKYLPEVFKLLDRESKELLPGYYESIRYQRGQAATQRELYLKSLMASGGERGVANFWGTLANVTERLMPSAKVWGEIIDRGSSLLSSIMLIGPEFIDYIKGQASEGNFMEVLFGKSTGEIMSTFKETWGKLTTLFESMKPTIEYLGKAFLVELKAFAEAVGVLAKIVGYLAEILAPIFNFLGKSTTGVSLTPAGNIRRLGEAAGIDSDSIISPTSGIVKLAGRLGAKKSLPPLDPSNVISPPGSPAPWATGTIVTSVVTANIDASGQPEETAQKIKEAIETIVIDSSLIQYSQTQNGFPKVSQ